MVGGRIPSTRAGVVTVVINAVIIGIKGRPDIHRGIDHAIGHDGGFDGINVSGGHTSPCIKHGGGAAVGARSGIGPVVVRHLGFSADSLDGQRLQFGVVIIRAIAAGKVRGIVPIFAQTPCDIGFREIHALAAGLAHGIVESSFRGGGCAKRIAAPARTLVADRSDIAGAAHVAPVP